MTCGQAVWEGTRVSEDCQVAVRVSVPKVKAWWSLMQGRLDRLLGAAGKVTGRQLCVLSGVMTRLDSF